MNACASFLLAAALLFALPAPAQGGGLLAGTVTDMSTLKPVAGVTVRASSANRQGEQVVVTDASGTFQLPHLPPGAYTLRFEARGYQSWTRGGIVLRLGSTRRVDTAIPPDDLLGCFFGLPPLPAIDVDSTRTGVSVDQHYLRNLPLPSR